MARKGSERLRMLLKLAAMKEQQAARQLGASSERLQQAEQQSRQLVQYRDEYQDQYVARTSGQSFSRSDLLNFQGFFRQLEQVQEQQTRVIDLRTDERERARQAWLETHTKRQLLTRVRERRLQKEALDAEKKLQRELDDRSQRKAFNSRAEHE